MHDHDTATASTSTTYTTTSGSTSTATCPANPATANVTAEVVTGSLTFQQLILIISCAALAITLLISLFNIGRQLRHYAHSKEQRQIIRIIFTPVLFAILSTISITSYPASLYVTPFLNLYEAFGLASLFLLFVHYVCPDEEAYNKFFGELELKNRKGVITPGGSLNWFKKTWIIIFLFVLVEIILVVAQLITTATGRYCATSNSIHYAHVWITVLTTLAIVIAVLRILRFYQRLRPSLSPHRPLLKLAAFKLIVFTQTVQTTAFSLLTHKLHDSGGSKLTSPDLAVGIPQLLVSVEQILFALGMLYAYSATPYKNLAKTEGPQMGMCAAAFDAMNPLDLVMGVVTAIRYLTQGRTWRCNSGGGTSLRTAVPINGLAPSRGSSPYGDVHSAQPKYVGGNFNLAGSGQGRLAPANTYGQTRESRPQY